MGGLDRGGRVCDPSQSSAHTGYTAGRADAALVAAKATAAWCSYTGQLRAGAADLTRWVCKVPLTCDLCFCVVPLRGSGAFFRLWLLTAGALNDVLPNTLTHVSRPALTSAAAARVVRIQQCVGGCQEGRTEGEKSTSYINPHEPMMSWLSWKNIYSLSR